MACTGLESTMHAASAGDVSVRAKGIVRRDGEKLTAILSAVLSLFDVTLVKPAGFGCGSSNLPLKISRRECLETSRLFAEAVRKQLFMRQI
jgi:hypothetical protein